jgi:bifunctional enzyme CysN/CysC
MAEVVWHEGASRDARLAAMGSTGGATVWLTGLSGSGKSTVAVEVERLLLGAGRATYMLDADNLRFGLNADLGFDRASREENVRRVGQVAALFADAGLVAIVPVISPYAEGRAGARAAHADLPFLLVHMATPLEVCEQRDPKGLYKRARAGEVKGMTGIDDPYEEPTDADLVLDGTLSPANAAAAILTHLP